MKRAFFLAACLLFTGGVMADDDAQKKDEAQVQVKALGMAGLLSGSNKVDLPEVILSVGEPLGGPWKLKSGTYYEVKFTADGSGEIGLDMASFSRAIWIDEIVIEGLEIRPYGVESIEFDDAGTMEIGFIAIKPGKYTIRIPGSTGDTQKLDIEIK